jgi:hypothetical protein
VPDHPINAEHLLAAATEQRQILEDSRAGTAWFALGPIAPTYADSVGWTADGPAMMRRFLAGVLDRYLATDPDRHSTTRKSLYGRDLKVRALKAYWGVTAHPMSPVETGRMLISEGFQPHRNTIPLWAREVAEDAEVLTWANMHRPFSHPAPARYPLTSRPAWRGDRSQWPSEMLWPPDMVDAGRNERALLISRARHTLSSEEHADRRGFDDLTDNDVLILLRESAAEWLNTYLAVANSGRLLRHFHVRVFDRWTEHPESLQVAMPLTTSVPDSGSISRQVSTSIQMAMHDIATGGRRALVSAAVSLVSRRTLAPEATTSHLRGLTLDGAATRTFTGAAASAAGPATESPVEQLYDIASKMRVIPEQAEEFARIYVTLRARIDFADTMGVAGMLRLRLADQSASLDIARVQRVDLMKELSTLIGRTPPTPMGMAYMALSRRDQAILSLKREDEGRALSLVARAFRELDVLVAEGRVDPRSELEARHQLSLATTGDYVRIVERVLSNATARRRSPGSDGGRARLSKLVSRCLTFAESTELRLHEIMNDFGLPHDRHSEGQISTDAWRVRTTIIVLRAELSSFTAIEAGMAELERPVARLAPDLARMGERYRELISLPDVANGDVPEIITLGMWVALLNGGRLPVAWDLTGALRKLPFLDRDPEELHPAIPDTRLVDLRRSAEWLGSRPLGVIGQCAMDGPVGVLLERTSGGLFDQWRS